MKKCELNSNLPLFGHYSLFIKYSFTLTVIIDNGNKKYGIIHQFIEYFIFDFDTILRDKKYENNVC